MMSKYQRNHPDPGLYLCNNPLLIIYFASDISINVFFAHPTIRQRKKVTTNIVWQKVSRMGSIGDREEEDDIKADGG